MIAEVGQPFAPQTRCTYTFTCGPAPDTQATPTLVPAIVPVVCVPWPSSGVSDGSLSLLYQSLPAISRPVNSGWLKSTPVSIEPTTTSPPPAAYPEMLSSSASVFEA